MKNERLRCSFCGRTQDEVKRLIAGPNAFICNECVDICMNLIMDETEQEEGQVKFNLPEKLPTPR